MRLLVACVVLVANVLALTNLALGDKPVRFGADNLLPDDMRSHYSRSVNFAPADGQSCDLNPPRFRWQYHPTQPGAGGDYLFTFQVAADKQFKKPLIDIQTEFNFYNTIPPFKGTGPFYWRIGYQDRLNKSAPMQWSVIRSFTITKDAKVWDRSMLARPDFASRPHPRILINSQRLPKLHKMIHTDPETRSFFERVQQQADEAIASDWYANMPDSDKDPASIGYVEMSQDLAAVAFCWRVTGEKKYADIKERALKMAMYPKGGRSSPQDAGGDSAEDSTQTTEALGLMYDWLYQDMTPQQRKDFAASLDWRIEHFVNHFAWKYDVRPRPASQPATQATASAPTSQAMAAATSRPATRTDRRRPPRPTATHPIVYGGSLSTTAGSHQFEGFWDTFPAALAAYEDSPNARLCFALGVNYMVGVGSGHGPDEGWNEGPGYGNSKFAWLTNATSYLDSVFPEFNIGRNPWLIRKGEWFRAVTPVGLQYAPWGHGSNWHTYIENGHLKSYRKLAYITGDGRFLANWLYYADLKDPELSIMRPWIECTLPLWRSRPKPVVKEDPVQLFSLAGWVTALSGSPSDPNTYKHGVGMIFACRPDGAYSHAFACDDSFHIFAYGQDISHAAGTGEKEADAYQTMSHNTILVDGLGQTQGRQTVPEFGRILAFGHKDNVVYWCGDATMAYPHVKNRVKTYWGSIDEIYDHRDLAYVTRVNRHVLFVRNKYFVILDDLAASQPAQWTWLYHALTSEESELEPGTGSFRYTIGGVQVYVRQLINLGEMDIQDRQDLDGLKNPLTGEDYTKEIVKAPGFRRYLAKHNLWCTSSQKQPTWRFLSVIYPVAPGSVRPSIQQLDDLTLEVKAGGDTDIISFNGETQQPANIIVDLAAIAPAGIHPAGAPATEPDRP